MKTLFLFIFGLIILSSCSDIEQGTIKDMPTENVIYTYAAPTSTQAFKFEYMVDIRKPWSILTDQEWLVGDTIILTTAREHRIKTDCVGPIKNLHSAIDDLTAYNKRLKDSIQLITFERNMYRNLYWGAIGKKFEKQ